MSSKRILLEASSSAIVESCPPRPETVRQLLACGLVPDFNGFKQLVAEVKAVPDAKEAAAVRTVLNPCEPPFYFPDSRIFYDIFRYTVLYKVMKPAPSDIVRLVAEYDALWEVDITPPDKQFVADLTDLDDVEDDVFVASDAVYSIPGRVPATDVYSLRRTSAGAPECLAVLSHIRTPNVLCEDQRSKQLYLYGELPSDADKPCLCRVVRCPKRGVLAKLYSVLDTKSDLWAGDEGEQNHWTCIGEQYLQCCTSEINAHDYVRFLDARNEFEPGFLIQWHRGVFDNYPAVRALDRERVYVFHAEEGDETGLVAVFRADPSKPRRPVKGEPMGIVDKTAIGSFVLPAASCQNRMVHTLRVYAAAHSPKPQVFVHAYYGSLRSDVDFKESLYNTSLHLIDLVGDKVTELWSWQSCLDLVYDLDDPLTLPQRFLQVGKHLILILFAQQAYFVSLRERTLRHKHISFCEEFGTEGDAETHHLLVPPMGAIIKRTMHMVEYNWQSEEEEAGQARVTSLLSCA